MSVVSWLLLRAKSATTIYLLSNVLTRIGAFVLIPLYTRRIDEAGYGDYVLAQTLLNLAPCFALGMPMAIARFYFDSKNVNVAAERFGTVARWTALIALAMGALALFVVLVLPQGENLRSRHLSLLLVAALVGTTLYSIPQQHARNVQRPFAVSALQLLEFTLTVTWGILLVSHFGRGLTGAIEAMALTYGILGILSAVFVFFVSRGKLELKLLGEALVLSLPYVPHFLAQWLQSVADRWALKLVGRDADVGTYGLAGQLSTPPSLVIAAWNIERTARSGETFRSGGVRAVAEELSRIVRTYAIISIGVALMVLVGLPLLQWVVGRPLAFTLVAPLLLVSVVESVYYPNQILAYYAGQSRLISMITVVSCGICVFLAWLLVPRIGIWGALVARLGSSLVRTVLMVAGSAWCVRQHRTASEPTAAAVGSAR